MKKQTDFRKQRLYQLVVYPYRTFVHSTPPSYHHTFVQCHQKMEHALIFSSNQYFNVNKHFRPKLVNWNERVYLLYTNRQSIKMWFNEGSGSFLRPTIPELWRFLWNQLRRFLDKINAQIWEDFNSQNKYFRCSVKFRMNVNVYFIWLLIMIDQVIRFQKNLLSLFESRGFGRHYGQKVLTKQIFRSISSDPSFCQKFYTD